MRRRDFIAGLGSTGVALPLAAHAQQSAVPVIGWVNATSAAEWADNTAAFHRGLSETGFVEGRNLTVDYRWADGDLDRMAEMASDLVRRKVAVIVVGGNIVGLRAAMKATQTIPIVFTTAADPIAAGVVSSLNRPGGNATGFALLVGELLPKRLELLHEMIPNAARIALLVSPHNAMVLQDDIQSANAAARRLGLEIMVLNAGTDSEIERAFMNAAQGGAGAVLVGSDTFFAIRREQIAALGLRHAMPIIGPTRQYVASGGLMSYGFGSLETYRQAGTYVGRILKGERPSELPVVQPTKFDLVINLKTAKTIGLTIPEAFLLRADEVIE
jgi:putative ABC transport system substrate-binding protein